MNSNSENKTWIAETQTRLVSELADWFNQKIDLKLPNRSQVTKQGIYFHGEIRNIIQRYLSEIAGIKNLEIGEGYLRDKNGFLHRERIVAERVLSRH
ncbi:MAG TPA: hypothetical protein VF893_06810 [Candidatus Bathyarchaeia archaeon]